MSFYTYFHTRNDTGKPFYVGKGKGRRAHDITSRNRHWSSIVKKHGHSVHIAAEWPTETEAFEHEKFLILCFKDTGLTLANATDGGEGWSGATHTDEYKSRMRNIFTGRIMSEETKLKMSVSAKVRCATPEFIARNTGENNPMKRHEIAARSGAAQAGKKLSEEHKQKISISGIGRVGANKGKTFSPEVRAKMSLASKGKPKSEEHRQRISVAVKAYAAKKKEALE